MVRTVCMVCSKTVERVQTNDPVENDSYGLHDECAAIHAAWKANPLGLSLHRFYTLYLGEQILLPSIPAGMSERKR